MRSDSRASPADLRYLRAKKTTTGPSINTRASLTTVATCPLSELTANALQHGTGAPQLAAIRREHTVTVALTDGRPDALPVVQRLRGASASSGRGMAIIDAISTHWGVTVYHDRKVVWCELTGH